MTIDDFMELCLDEETWFGGVYDLTKERKVFTGCYCDCPDEYRYADVATWDVDTAGMVWFNINPEV